MGIDPLAIAGEQRRLLLNRLLLVEAGLARVGQRFAQDSPLEEAGFEPSVPRQGTAFFTEGNELYPLPINHQVGDRASGEKRLSRGRRTRCQRLRSLH